jgi:hypothetical protein
MQVPSAVQGFTPFLKMASLDAEPPGGWLASTPGAVVAATGPLLATASSYTVLKGAGSAATPLVLPNTFIPVPTAAGMRPLGGKLRPGGGAPPLLAHQASGGFTIPAYGRPFTQLDFLTTGELPCRAAGMLSGASHRLRRGPCRCLAGL